MERSKHKEEGQRNSDHESSHLIDGVDPEVLIRVHRYTVLGAVARKGVRVDASTAVELGVVDVYGLVIQDLRSLGKAQAG